jgi:hypothetical protein
MDAQHADKLRATLAEYLHTRRALEHTLAGTETLLGQIIDYLATFGATGIGTPSAALRANLPVEFEGSWRNHRPSILRTFAHFVSVTSPDVEVRVMSLLTQSPPRTTC